MMNNDSMIYYVNSSTSDGAPSPGSWRDVAAPVLAVILSVLYWWTFSLENIFEDYGPGLGVLVFVLAYFAFVILMLGKRICLRASGICLMTAAVVLSLCCALYALPGLMMLNCFIILITAAIATFSLSGQLSHSGFSLRAVPWSFVLSVRALFTRIDRPFRLMSSTGKDRRAGVGRVILTVGVTVAALIIVLALLASADMVFGSWFSGLWDWLSSQAPLELIWKIDRTIGLALFICSGLFFIREPLARRTDAGALERERHVSPFLVPALLLDVVYVVFCAIQLRYLFGGALAASMAGGWAEYARTGFFQLVAVAGINLVLCLSAADKKRFSSKGGLVLRIADGAMLVLTAVILLSAARRMQLYILAFGMSVLRYLTLWAMLVIAVGLIAGAVKLIRPDFLFWRVFAGFALAAWCILCLCNPAGVVANYNVSAYLDGGLDEVDMQYLEELTPDAAGALRRLISASDEYDGQARKVLSRFGRDVHDPKTSISRWKLSFLWVGKDERSPRSDAPQTIASTVVFEGGGEYIGVVWDDGVYAPYGGLEGLFLNKYYGKCLGYLDGDPDDRICELKNADPDVWLIEYLDSGLMDSPVVLRRLHTEDAAVPKGVVSFGYELWDE